MRSGQIYRLSQAIVSGGTNRRGGAEHLQSEYSHNGFSLLHWRTALYLTAVPLFQEYSLCNLQKMSDASHSYLSKMQWHDDLGIFSSDAQHTVFATASEYPCVSSASTGPSD